jgi:TetR/AcrR family fatty acid metabolism transcriptional regulator
MAWTGDEERKEQKRKQIMHAALKVFSQKGYSPTALDEVAHEAGIAKGTLYLYFRDKEDLITSTLMSVMDDIKERMLSRISDDMPPLEILEMIALILFEYFVENDEFYNIYLTILNYNLVSSYEKLFQNMLSRKKELFELEHRLVEGAKAQGLIRDDLSTADMVMAYDGIVNNVIDQMFFLNMEGEAHGSVIDPVEKARLVMRLFLEGAGAKQRS